jgi:N-methylhydantoinase A
VAAALDIRDILVPVAPGVFTAVGMLASDVEHHSVRAVGGLLSAPSTRERATTRLEELYRDARTLLFEEGYAAADVRLVGQADLRYAGQASELTIPLSERAFDDLGALREAFQREYTATYGYASDEDLELVNVRCIATGVREHRLDFRAVTVAASGGPVASRRMVHFARGAAAVETPVVARDAIGEAPTRGPLLVESYDSTITVPPEATIVRDPFGNLRITRP